MYNNKVGLFDWAHHSTISLARVALGFFGMFVLKLVDCAALTFG